MFTRYAMPPNVLRLCGPEIVEGSLFDVCDKEGVSRFRELLLEFTGAVPYLRLIAQSNGIKDEFDKRVIEAYWLGNKLLEKVKTGDVYDNVDRRFRKKMNNKDWSWLIKGSISQAKPFHGFHVFDIYRRAGLIQSGMRPNILETMDKCRIAWGTVSSLGNGNVVVEYKPLIFFEKKLIFGKKIARKVVSLNLLIKKGDEVSIHWGHVCDKITQEQKRNLIFWTKYHLSLTNKTI